ncbi:hypothetical protein N7462_009142 [Penicillium macrosclerotiorum]|uniref:uncharacterized protein n=1 Tax=Penicillium macrosclerotiorum TaxID=303699 RepID=UPI0025496629|nr:uncharacterized protein N7462_009142 [Penicillium macrosclerotiorum]KAJ5676245.1 hypothetical protein N7462_009142 [Penicillium macrosclerotiorum]
MALKRKASFSVISSGPSMPAPSEWGMVGSSQDLPSRTRKRFRDGRPSDEVVYGESSNPKAHCLFCTAAWKTPALRETRANQPAEKTLRWIFSAQQQQRQQQAAASMDMMDDAMMDSESTIPTPQTVDPRQQTLLRFFQPSAQPPSPFRPSRAALVARANETAMEHDEMLRRQAFAQMTGTGSSSGSEMTSPGVPQADGDMDMDMDMDVETDQSSESSNPVSKWGFWNGGNGMS